jgi:hypothetical protein
MYRDLKNFEIISVQSDNEVELFMNRLDEKVNKIKIGFDKLSEFMNPLTFDEAFYAIAGLDFSKRFDDFFILRDIEEEEKILKQLNPDGEKYIFIHDDKKRGFKIDESKITSKYKKIYNDDSIPIFNCISLIENAEEVHVMQSSIKDLINSFKFDKPTFYLHEYIRNYSNLIDSKGYNKFIKIK